MLLALGQVHPAPACGRRRAGGTPQAATRSTRGGLQRHSAQQCGQWQGARRMAQRGSPCSHSLSSPSSDRQRRCGDMQGCLHAYMRLHEAAEPPHPPALPPFQARHTMGCRCRPPPRQAISAPATGAGHWPGCVACLPAGLPAWWLCSPRPSPCRPQHTAGTQARQSSTNHPVHVSHTVIDAMAWHGMACHGMVRFSARQNSMHKGGRRARMRTGSRVPAGPPTHHSTAGRCAWRCRRRAC